MKSLVFKRSIVVAGHKTSVSLEDAFWNGLKEIARERHMNLSELVAEIDAQRQPGNLSSTFSCSTSIEPNFFPTITKGATKLTR